VPYNHAVPQLGPQGWPRKGSLRCAAAMQGGFVIDAEYHYVQPQALRVQGAMHEVRRRSVAPQRHKKGSGRAERSSRAWLPNRDAASKDEGCRIRRGFLVSDVSDQYLPHQRGLNQAKSRSTVQASAEAAEVAPSLYSPSPLASLLIGAGGEVLLDVGGR
jgi:hypothetical protein